MLDGGDERSELSSEAVESERFLLRAIVAGSGQLTSKQYVGKNLRA
jgi:hypothetical protein